MPWSLRRKKSRMPRTRGSTDRPSSSDALRDHEARSNRTERGGLLFVFGRGSGDALLSDGSESGLQRFRLCEDAEASRGGEAGAVGPSEIRLEALPNEALGGALGVGDEGLDIMGVQHL